MAENTSNTHDLNESAGDMLARLGDDARKWATEFRASAVKAGYPDMAQDFVFAWFANAIEHSHDVRTGRGPVVLPDGSAFFVAQ